MYSADKGKDGFIFCFSHPKFTQSTQTFLLLASKIGDFTFIYRYTPDSHRNISEISSPTRPDSKLQSPIMEASLRRLLPVKNLPELRNDISREDRELDRRSM